MKRLMLLGSGTARTGWIERVLSGLEPRPAVLAGTMAVTDCDGLLVVDDGSPQGFDAIRKALALRESHPRLPIAVVTSLDADWSDGECLARSESRVAVGGARIRHSSADRIRRLAGGWHDGFDVRIAADAITFEYQEQDP